MPRKLIASAACDAVYCVFSPSSRAVSVSCFVSSLSAIVMAFTLDMAASKLMAVFTADSIGAAILLMVPTVFCKLAAEKKSELELDFNAVLAMARCAEDSSFMRAA